MNKEIKITVLNKASQAVRFQTHNINNHKCSNLISNKLLQKLRR